MARTGDIALGGLLGIVILGGAFENLKLVDFGVFGLIVFVFYKFNARWFSKNQLSFRANILF